jgi:hypothetical protein
MLRGMGFAQRLLPAAKRFLIFIPILLVIGFSAKVVSLGSPSGPSHTLAVYCIWLVGMMFWLAARARWPNFSALGPFLLTGLLQFCLVLIFQIYSGISLFLGRIGAFSVVLLMLLSFSYFCFRSVDLLRQVRLEHDSLKWSVLVFSVVSTVILYFEVHELPRVVMLSSDPDIHAFHARQVLRFARVPWTQEYWGELSLGYPVGFSVLSALWAALSFQDVRNTVTMLPMIELVLGFGALLELFLLGRPWKRDWVKAVIGAAALGYFVARALPYGHQENRFHLEGTPRLATIGPLLMLVSLGVRSRFFRESSVASERFIWLLATAFLCAYMLLLNPANILVAVGICVGNLLVFGLRNAVGSVRLVLLAALVSFLFFVLDPYFYGLLFGKSQGWVTLSVVGQAIPSGVTLAGLLASLKNAFLLQSLLATWSHVVSDFAPVSAGHWLVLCAVAILLLNSSVQRTCDSGGLTVLIQFLLCLALFAIVGPTFGYVSEQISSLRLLAPYSVTQMGQYVTVVLLFVVVMLVFRFVFFNAKWASFLSGLVLVGLAHVVETGNSAVVFGRRSRVSGSLGKATANDLAVIGKVEGLFRRYRNERGFDVGVEVPKILVSNILVEMGRELWLFPVGGQRSLFAYDTFPLAFFYFQANSEYSYKNYQEKVCERFDAEWLHRRGIRFLFISEDANGCIFGLPDIRKRARTLFSSGGSAFLEF